MTQPNRKPLIAVAAALLVAAVGGGVASRSLIHSGAAVTASSGSGVASASAQSKIVVPFLGPFAYNHKGLRECGKDVRLMEGALRNTKPPVRKTPARNCVGLATVKQIKAFQKRQHIPPSGIYGLRTHRALAHAYTKQQARDLRYLLDARLYRLHVATILIVTSHARVFQNRMQYCDYGSLASCGHRADWPAWPDVPRHTDCSGYVQWVYYQAGLPNPNVSGVGNTTSLWTHGTRIANNGPLHVGDLIFYGYNNSHVEVYTGHGLTSGHGSFGIHVHPYGYRFIYGIRRYF